MRNVVSRSFAKHQAQKTSQRRREGGGGGGGGGDTITCPFVVKIKK